MKLLGGGETMPSDQKLSFYQCAVGYEETGSSSAVDMVIKKKE
jgi:hypothetical protein